MDPATIGIGLIGAFAAAVVFLLTYRDATRVGVSRSRLWACATSGALAFGFVLFLFTSAPMPGVLMTANTGAVLYGFERELTRRDEQPAEPGQLPFDPVGSDTTNGTLGAEPQEGASQTADSGPSGRVGPDE